MAEDATRREFLQWTGGSWALVAAGKLPWINQQDSAPRSQAKPEAGNLLTNPRYAVGAKFRLSQFIRRGADPQPAEAVFRSLNDLAAEPWVAAWTRLAEPWEQQAARAEAQGQSEAAKTAYSKAAMYYGIAKFPVINHPAKQVAYRRCIDNYLKAAHYFEPPLERVVIPFAGKEIIGYLRLPKGVTRPPVVIATGGIDVYKEDRDTSELLEAGLAAFSTDMPGNGQCPLWYTPDADRFYSAVIDYLLTRKDVDGTRMGILGRSYGGYWGAKMAYVESKRLRAAVDWGGPSHFTFQQDWFEHLEQDRLYLWSLLDSMIYAHHVRDLNELRQQAPTLSLQAQGWLDKPCAPLLVVNGEKDPWINIRDLYLLLENGEPKSARTYANGGHMGGDPHADNMVAAWLKLHLLRT
ncbi:MAG TPA: alpha/beta hydrolase [Terriglobales bacterium]|nr:alpha/beta hydrolase [Terriglobales bacterium]